MAAADKAMSDTPAQRIGEVAATRAALIVDDSRMIRSISRKIVSELGYHVSEAENGKEALARCTQSMPNLIIVDWDMPIMTGIEFVTALRAIEGGKKPKVVFCTSKSAMKDVQRGAAAGANEWIVKPFDKPKMLAKLTKIGAV